MLGNPTRTRRSMAGMTLPAQVHHAHHRRPARGHLGERHDVLNLLDPLDRQRVALSGEVEGDDLFHPLAARAVGPGAVTVSGCASSTEVSARVSAIVSASGATTSCCFLRGILFLLREPQHPVEFLRAHQTFLHFVESCLRHVAHARGARDGAQFLRAGRARDRSSDRLGERKHFEEADRAGEAALAARCRSRSRLGPSCPWSRRGSSRQAGCAARPSTTGS